MPASWHRVALKDLLTAEFPGEWGTEPLGIAGNAKVLRSTNLDDEGHLDYETGAERQIPLSKLTTKKLIRGDILLEGSGGGPGKPVGRVGWFDPPDDNVYLGSNFFRTLRPSKSVDGKFLMWRLLLAYYDPRIWAFQQQTTGIINLKVSEYLEQEFELPSLPEQRRIAEILDAADEAIRQAERVIAKLKAVKAGLLHDLLTRGLDEHGHLRDPQAHPEQFKDSPLGRIPREWEVCPIEDKLERIIDYRGKTPEKITSGIPLITAKNVRDGFLDPEPREYIAEENYDSWMTRGIPKQGDILFTTEAPLGNVARVPDYEMALAQRLLTLQANPSTLDSGYLFWLLLWPNSRRRLGQRSTGSTVLGIKQSIFRGVPFQFPPLSEQKAIAAALDAHDARIRAEETELAKLRQVKRGLMDDLLTGRVRVV